jgi:hypothetical protein
MKQYKVTKSQTIWDIAVQEHGTDQTAFMILQDNPGIENQLPQGITLGGGITFDISLPVLENSVILIRQNPTGYNKQIADQLTNVKS